MTVIAFSPVRSTSRISIQKGAQEKMDLIDRSTNGGSYVPWPPLRVVSTQPRSLHSCRTGFLGQGHADALPAACHVTGRAAFCRDLAGGCHMASDSQALAGIHYKTRSCESRCFVAVPRFRHGREFPSGVLSAATSWAGLPPDSWACGVGPLLRVAGSRLQREIRF